MATSWALNRSQDRILGICRAGLDDRELRHGVLAELAAVVPFDAYAWPLSDPESATGLRPMARIPCPAELPLLIKLKYLTAIGRWTALVGARPPVLSLAEPRSAGPAATAAVARASASSRWLLP